MGSYIFPVLCMLHSLVAITTGSLMMFFTLDASIFTHGNEIARKLTGSTPHDQLLIQISDSFSGLLLFAIGLLLFMVAFVKDQKFQSFFARGCVVLHVIMAIWRIYFEMKLAELGHEWLRKVVGDVVLGLSWVFFLLYSWKEKYD